MLVSASVAAGESAPEQLIGGVVAVSPLPSKIGRALARSDRLHVSRATEDRALRRLAATGKPLFCGGRKRYAALTFDDGPSARTDEMLRLLRRHRVSATFFVVGAEGKLWPRALRRLARAGVVANHSFDHSLLTRLTGVQVRDQLERTDAVIAKAVAKTRPRGVERRRYRMLRPPYGLTDPGVSAVMRRRRDAEILWSADSEDAMRRPWRAVGRKVVEGLGPGAIILMHDGPSATLPALKHRVLPAIRRKRLTMVTIPELLVLNPPGRPRLERGPRGCRHTGKINVSGYYLKRSRH